MISVVICSINKNLAEQVKSNIDNTIGVPWQPIIIDNTNSPRGLTEVYNQGAISSEFPVICFVHEDVTFLTMDWGKMVIDFFNDDPGLGMVGVAGSGYKSKTLSGWMTSIPEFDRCNVLHVDKNGNTKRLYFDQPPGRALKEVVTLDGIFLCTRKSVIEAIPFDQDLLKGFHLYDLDISFRISRRYKIAVCFGIDIIHHTEGGDFGNKWIDNTIWWHKKYSGQLPVSGHAIQSSVRQNEYGVKRFWLNRLKSENISLSRRIGWIARAKVISHISLWPHILVFFIFRPIKFTLEKLKIKAAK